MEYLFLNLAAALFALIFTSVVSNGSCMENNENQFLYKIKTRTQQEVSVWKNITGFYDRRLKEAQLIFLTSVYPGRSSMLLVHETRVAEFEEWALRRGLSIRNKGRQYMKLLQRKGCYNDVQSIHTPGVWVKCDFGSGYHCDRQSNCVCDAKMVLGYCVQDNQCCNGMTCDTSKRQCSCISSTWIPVEATFSNCCSNKGAYKPYYSATFCV